MYPSQMSLIPVTVALTRFIEQKGLSAVFGWYPYWYLGVPYRFLTGPVVPVIEYLLHKLLPNVSLFNITIYLIILSFLAGAAGWGLLVYKVQSAKFKVQSVLIFCLLLILPWRYFFALALDEASFTIARNFLPFALIAFWSYLKRKDKTKAFWAIVAGFLILLINTSILPILLIGLAGLVLAKSFKKGKFRKVSKNIKSSLFLVACCLLFATLWYTPSYWITILTNPSIGGASGVKVIFRIFDLLKAGVPLILAVGSVYFSGRIRSRFAIFWSVWTFTFIFLTVFRFIGDPDFWMDWTSWLYELEVGAALILAMNFQFSIFLPADATHQVLQAGNFQLNSKPQTFVLAEDSTDKKNPKRFGIGHLSLAILFLLPFYSVWRIHLALGRPALISKDIPEGVRNLEKLAGLAGDKRVFLSGSTVFWAGSTGSPLNQIRGGVDQGATNPFWNHAAYQLREGDNPQLASAWLNTLGVSWVLVHTEVSDEFYHDFRNVYKWSEIGKLAWEENGDEIYEINGSSLAWEVDQNKLRGVLPPKDGKDIVALEKYLSARIKPLGMNIVERGYLVENPGKGDIVQVVLTYNNSWKAYSNNGERLKVEKDPLGHLLVFTERNREVLLTY